MNRLTRLFNLRGEKSLPTLESGAKIWYFAPMAHNTSDQDAMRKQLEDLRAEHRDLDDVIARVVEHAPFDQLRVQRLKKRKLLLRDLIQQLESNLLPDIIA